MITEADVKKEIKTYLTSIGAWWMMHVPSGFGRNGIPDFVGCYRGWFLGIEVKRPPEGGEKNPEPTKWQAREIEDIRKAEGVAFVAWRLDQVQLVIAAIDKVEGRA